MFTLHPSRRILGTGALFVALAATLCAVLWPGKPAEAGLSWCAADPLISVDGRLLDINAMIPSEEVSNVSGPIVFVFHVPVGSKAHIVFQNSAFFSVRSEIVYDQKAWDGKGKLEIPVDVLVTSKNGDDFEVRATALDDSLNYKVHKGKGGRADKPMKVKAHIKGLGGFNWEDLLSHVPE